MSALSTRQKSILFYTLVTIIVLVSLLLCYPIYKHFWLGQTVTEISTILTLFGAEVLGGFGIGISWIFSSDSESKNTDEKTTLIVKHDREETPPQSEEEASWKAKVEVGVGYLDKSRDASQKSMSKKKRFLKQAEEVFTSVPTASKYHVAATYNLATVFREQQKYNEAMEMYGVVENSMLAVLKDENKSTYKKRLADIYLMKGRLFDSMGKSSDAKKHYMKSWKLDPTEYDVALNIYERCKSDNDLDEAGIWFTVMSKMPEHKKIFGIDKSDIMGV